jgi:hypothetical protein
MPSKGVNITKSDLTKLKRAYNLALKFRLEEFTFQGQKLLTTYAKYLIEYLETL